MNFDFLNMFKVDVFITVESSFKSFTLVVSRIDHRSDKRERMTTVS